MNGNLHNKSKRKSSVDFITGKGPGLTQTGLTWSTNGSSLFITRFCKQKYFWNGNQRKAFLVISIIVSFPVLSKHEKDNVKINGHKNKTNLSNSAWKPRPLEQISPEVNRFSVTWGQMEQIAELHGSFYFKYLRKNVFVCLRMFVHVCGDAVRPEENTGSQEAGTTGSYEPPDMRPWNWIWVLLWKGSKYSSPLSRLTARNGGF